MTNAEPTDGSFLIMCMSAEHSKADRRQSDELKRGFSPALVDLINLALSPTLDASLGVHVPRNSHGGASPMARNTRVQLGSSAAGEGRCKHCKVC